ncbi:MAG: 4-phosphoerythronate dehydrogenase [Bacteroidales bacterium]|nr:4-phosphoerythronate dehydrogenase [Bacteroidales bacterium]
MKIVVDDKIPFIRGVFEPYAEVVYLPGAAIGAADVRDADAIVTRTRTRCGRALLEGSSVRAIASATIGYDHIDTSYCESRGIAWSNAPGCNSGSVAQWVRSVLETLARNHGFTLAGRTLGIVGVGHVGTKVAALARELGMTVLLCDPPRAAAEGPQGFVSLEEIIDRADIITLHVPLDASTKYMFDVKRIATLRPNQILINSSRGEVVDGTALKEALKTGRLMAAALDVWENEPEIDPELAALVEIATPHIAGYSLDGKANGTSAAVRFVAKTLGLPGLLDFSVVLDKTTDQVGGDVVVMPDPACSVMPDPDFVVHDPDFVMHDPDFVMPDPIGHLYLPYDVLADSARLKADVSAFEHLRETYPLRRE